MEYVTRLFDPAALFGGYPSIVRADNCPSSPVGCLWGGRRREGSTIACGSMRSSVGEAYQAETRTWIFPERRTQSSGPRAADLSVNLWARHTMRKQGHGYAEKEEHGRFSGSGPRAAV